MSSETRHPADARPRVSIAIATYNAQAHLAAAIRSALHQTLGAIELLLVDDGSTDATLAIAERFVQDDPRVTLLRMARNGGPAAARNRALAHARGDWFAILDSDDLLAADRIERLVAIAEHEQADIVADNLILFRDDAPADAAFFLDPTRVPSRIGIADYLDHTVMYGRKPNLGYLKPVIRTERLRTLGLRYDETLRIAEDDDFVVRMLMAGMRYHFVSEAGYGYRRHSGSTSHRLSSPNAQAMRSAAAGLSDGAAAARQTPSVRKALRRRRDAFDDAAAFARVIDLLKRRDLPRALGVALANPRTIPLLRMPLGARLARLRGQTPGGTARPDGAAAAALRQLRDSVGIDR